MGNISNWVTNKFLFKIFLIFKVSGFPNICREIFGKSFIKIFSRKVLNVNERTQTNTNRFPIYYLYEKVWSYIIGLSCPIVTSRMLIHRFTLLASSSIVIICPFSYHRFLFFYYWFCKYSSDHTKFSMLRIPRAKKLVHPKYLVNHAWDSFFPI